MVNGRGAAHRTVRVACLYLRRNIEQAWMYHGGNNYQISYLLHSIPIIFMDLFTYLVFFAILKNISLVQKNIRWNKLNFWSYDNWKGFPDKTVSIFSKIFLVWI